MLFLLALLTAAALATVLYFHKRRDSGSQNKRLLDSSRNNDSDSLNNEAKLTSQYGSMLITQALLKSRQHQQQKSRRNITYSNAGYGVFAQSDPDTDDTQFNYLTARDFGLVLEGSWRELQQRLHSLNRNPPTPNTRYKLLFLARHGQGYHNLAIEIYGQKAWDDYWSLLDTDGNIVWGPDPELTPLGTEQAKRNNIAWRKQIDDRDILFPKTHYVSPFTRALDTYKETWNRLRNDKTDGVHLSLKTCVKRSVSTPATAAAPAAISANVTQVIPLRTVLRKRMSCGPPITARHPKSRTSASGGFLTSTCLVMRATTLW